MALTGGIIGAGTLVTLLGSGNPAAGLTMMGGLAAGFSSFLTPHVAAPLPTPAPHVGGEAASTQPIDICHGLVTTTSVLNQRLMSAISEDELRSLITQIVQVTDTDVTSFDARKLSKLANCVGVKLLKEHIGPLKTRFEDAKNSVLEGRMDSLVGQWSDRLFDPLNLLRKNALLAEINLKLRLINDMHAKLRTFVVAMNSRLLAMSG